MHPLTGLLWFLCFDLLMQLTFVSNLRHTLLMPSIFDAILKHIWSHIGRFPGVQAVMFQGFRQHHPGILVRLQHGSGMTGLGVAGRTTCWNEGRSMQ